MKRFLWLGLLLLSTSWLFFITQFTYSEWSIGTLLLILGILCMILGMWTKMPAAINKKYLFLLVPLLLSLLIVPYPYNIGLIVLAIGLLLGVVLSRFQKTQAVVLGTTLSGLILTVQTAFLPFYTLFVSPGHRIDILSSIISPIGNMLGLNTSVNNGIMYVHTIQDTYPFTTTWEKLGFYPWFNILLGALILFFLFYNKRKFLISTILFLLTSFMYIMLRYVVYLFGYLNTGELSIFWDPVYSTMSFVPFTLLLMKIIPFHDACHNRDFLREFIFNKKHAVAFLVGFLFVFSLIGACVYQDPGVEKNRRVLIDETHSDWEDTTTVLDKEWYGLLSTYNYYSWAEWLGHYYDVERTMNATLTLDFLQGYDILILKCPTQSYSEEEIQSVLQFVHHGGGLYLIGDHTNVFGMNTFLNQISERIGLRFKTDATYEIGTGDLSTYKPDILFHHPIVSSVQQFDFMTSCSLEPTSLLSSLTMESIIIGDRLISEPGTYSTENFFRESVASPDSEYGYVLQSAAVKYGDGRVVAFTDSTVFSSFSAFTDGYPMFTLGVMEYLNRTNSPISINLILFGIAAICFCAFLVVVLTTKKTVLLWILFCAGLLAFSGAVPLFSSLNDINYQNPAQQTDYVQVCFDQHYSSGNISVKPTISFFNDNNNYGTFYVWTQRVGCVPSLETTLQESLNGDIMVFINPTTPFDTDAIASLTTFMQQGGKILVLDSAMNNRSTTNTLTSSFGIWINNNTTDQHVNQNSSTMGQNTSNATIDHSLLSITGGTSIPFEYQNLTQGCFTAVTNGINGKQGKLVVVDSSVFNDELMGGTFTNPNGLQRLIYNTQFFLFEQILLKE